MRERWSGAAVAVWRHNTRLEPSKAVCWAQEPLLVSKTCMWPAAHISHVCSTYQSGLQQTSVWFATHTSRVCSTHQSYLQHISVAFAAHISLVCKGSGRQLTCSKGVTPTSHHKQPSDCSHRVGEAGGRGCPRLGLDPLPCACHKVQGMQPTEGVLVGLSASHDEHALLYDCGGVGMARLGSVPCKPRP